MSFNLLKLFSFLQKERTSGFVSPTASSVVELTRSYVGGFAVVAARGWDIKERNWKIAI